MSNIVPIRKCRTCGKPATRRTLALNDVPVVDFNSCDECVGETDAELARARPVFDAMIGAGVPRDVANDAMTFLLDRWKP